MRHEHGFRQGAAREAHVVTRTNVKVESNGGMLRRGYRD